MYLTRVKLDIKRRETMRALSSPNLFHGAIEDSFGRDRERKLWRIDLFRGDYYLLIVSGRKPEYNDLVRQFGKADELGYDCRDYDPFLKIITEGSCWHFRLTANPVKSLMHSNADMKLRGTVNAHVTEAYQKEWLLKRAEKKGFYLLADEFDAVNHKWYTFRKGSGGHPLVSFISVTYEGILRVQDPDKFRDLLCTGIGREKAYGQGMMTIAQK
jgi:CRISPR system Cascade subunit CasE